LHFMFHIQTKAHYMSQTILVGGAKYRATGRGFVTQHTPMDEQFRFFASSHLYLGVELGAGLIIMGVFSVAKQYFGRTWSLWLASMSFLASPFWFNPLSFEWNVVVNDYKKYLNWMGGTSGGPSKSWSMWWTDDNSYFKGMTLTSKLFYVVKAGLFVLMANGIRTSDLFKANLTLNKPLINISGLCIAIVLLFALRAVYQSNRGNLPYAAKETIGIILFLSTSVGVFILFLEDTDAIRYTLAGYYFMGAVCQIGLLCGVKAVKGFYYVHDLVCGHIIFIPLFFLAGLQFFHHIHTWLLYQNALSSDVVVSDILRYAQKAQKAGGEQNDEELIEQVAELRKVLQKQEQMLMNAGLLEGGGDGEVSRNESTDALTELVTSNAEDEIKIQQPTQMGSLVNSRVGGRAVSMTGLDVWGPMTIGDDQDELQRGNDAPYQTADLQARGPMDSNSGFSFSQPDKMPPR